MCQESEMFLVQYLNIPMLPGYIKNRVKHEHFSVEVKLYYIKYNGKGGEGRQGEEGDEGEVRGGRGGRGRRG